LKNKGYSSQQWYMYLSQPAPVTNTFKKFAIYTQLIKGGISA